jgi:hypothetical protein
MERQPNGQHLKAGQSRAVCSESETLHLLMTCQYSQVGQCSSLEGDASGLKESP